MCQDKCRSCILFQSARHCVRAEIKFKYPGCFVAQDETPLTPASFQEIEQRLQERRKEC